MLKQGLIVAVALSVSACDKKADYAMDSVVETSMVVDVSEELVDGGSAEGDTSIPAITPQIAYDYDLSYAVGSQDVAKAQASHVALCDKLGAARCRVMSQQQASASAAWGKISLQVDSKIARQFGEQLDRAVSGLGGQLLMREITAEDVSKQMVDAAARMNAKQALADRLLILIQRRDGKVAELVEAERAFAEAQEELEGARKWMAELQGRVAMSTFDLAYNPDDQGRATAPRRSWLRDAIGDAGVTLANSLAALITFLLAALPWVVAIWALVRFVRWRGWLRNTRWPWRRKAAAESVPDV